MKIARAALKGALVALVAGGLVPLAGAAPAQAAAGCTDETPPSVLQDGCDDATPPETSVSSSVTPNAAGLVTTSSVTFTLGSSVDDGDLGPFGFECRLTGTPTSYDWQACPSIVTLTGLPDAAPGTYVFEARAVDLGDRAIDPDTLLGPGSVVDTPDHDQTPVRVAWGQDTRAPFVFVTGSTYDEATPTQPVVTSETVPIRLNSSEPGSTFECTDNGTAIPCSAGRFELAGAAPGRHTFTARTLDRAGNASGWSDPIEFFVPRNIVRTTGKASGSAARTTRAVRVSKGWRTVRDAGYFRGDALRATTRGARLVLPRTEVGELRLLAATGPRFGKVRVRVGNRAWHVVDLAAPAASSRQLVVIDRYSGIRTGRITIESLSRKPVVVDAVVARPNRFPAAS
ncbi:hypothetical protein SAMN04489844_1549 [Nocardioides exalbidus]|uniref:Ig-like domain (Group 3) n=1 Tax=Nocardioides exalbidus TaxID=402596 RepID=A0A1H4P7T4_9ACTN|nr:hypothetical protein [Nocardioides exalbidus]SEC03513.1 hypothetical protein SAMN04489844_1549 [Nocardioides exalbidus]